MIFLVSPFLLYSELEHLFQEVPEEWEEKLQTVQKAERQERPVAQEEQEVEACSESEYNVAHVSILDCNNTNAIDPSKFKHKTENFRAGAIARAFKQWKKLTNDKWILNMVKGYEIEFLSKPRQTRRPRPLKLHSSSQGALDSALIDFLQTEVIESCDEEEEGFYSTLFPVPKKDGTARIIFNLSDLNEYIDTNHFKMDTVKSAVDLMTRDCYFGSIDYKSAYYSVSIDPKFRKYLRFEWKGKSYQYTVMAQGLCTAPRDWTKLFKPPLAVLRKAGFTILMYIDDTIFIEESADDLRRAMNAATNLFDNLGVTISVKKSVLEPVQEIEYLGFVLNSKTMTVKLTQDKKNKIERLARKLVKKDKFRIQELAEFIGNVVAAEQGVWSAPLHYKTLEKERNRFLERSKGEYNYSVEMTGIIKSELQWWINNIQQSVRFAVYPAPRLVLYSDASCKGWGGHIENGPSTGGDWSAEEAEDHINVLELKGAFLTLQTFADEYEDCHIKMMLDNTTAIACINKFGSTKPKLLALCLEIFAWAQNRNLFLSAAYVPGVDNVLADRESRTHNTDIEWQLKPKWFKYLCEKFGTPEIDLFATRINTQLSKYVSWRPDPHAQWVDAFSMPWTGMFTYMFPPFSMLTKVMQKLDQEGGSTILVVPDWPNSAWYARLMRRMTAPQVKIPGSAIMLPQSPGKAHPLGKRLRLLGCKLSGIGSETKI